MKSYISDGLVSESLLLLRSINDFNCTDKDQVRELHVTYGINKESALNFAIQCDWINADGHLISITPKGNSVISAFNGYSVSESLWQRILYDYVSLSKPAWTGLIPKGRKETFLFMTPDEQRCFIQSGLMKKPVTTQVVNWWDKLADEARGKKQDNNNETGRTGELLTLEYEKKRTGKDAEWEAIESNLAGFDIISYRDSASDERILIEVKSSTQDIDHAEMIISRNEWDTAWSACNRDRYYFYAWLITGDIRFAKIPVETMKKHIPEDAGGGKWKDITIPFILFSELFRNYNMLS